MAESKTVKTWKIKVSGRVQGVGYRYFVMDLSQTLSIRGWVKNCMDGSVEIMAQGKEEQMSYFLQELRQGPRMASVHKIETEILEQEEFKSFTIKGW